MKRRELLKSLLVLPVAPQLLNNNSTATTESSKYVLIDGLKYKMANFILGSRYIVNNYSYHVNLKLACSFIPQIYKTYIIEFNTRYGKFKFCGALTRYQLDNYGCELDFVDVKGCLTNFSELADTQAYKLFYTK